VSIAPTGWQGNPADGFAAVAVREIVERHGLFERETAAEAIKNFEALAGRERVTFEFGHATRRRQYSCLSPASDLCSPPRRPLVACSMTFHW